MALKLSKIDDFLRSDHFYLKEDDRCWFFGEYTAQRRYDYSKINSLISNFKKPVDRKGLPEWRYKENAINKIANTFRSLLKRLQELKFTLVPIPPSKAKSDRLYDDRVLRVLEVSGRGLGVDIRELVRQRQSTPPAHLITPRPTPEDLIHNYYIDEEVANPVPEGIALFDDVLTDGAHFKAMQSVLKERYPRITTIGVFVTRRVYPDAEELDE